MTRLQFQVDARARGSRARAARFHTLHGEVLTPVFMPVGTQATVRGLSVDDLRAAGSTVLLANAYHLLLRPGLEVFERLGGIHRLMQWDGSVLTDSGGFQVFSLAEDRAITEEGAVFRSYVDGTRIVLSPERSIAVQQAIGSDIMMAMDQCVASTADHATASAAMHLTRRWAARSLAARGDSPRALFGIVQGACFEDLRRESAEALTRLPFDGFAIGGLAVGESKVLRERFTELTTDLLPDDLPRYLMGVGTPADLLEAVHRGVDMFDCSIPSLLAKQGVAFTSRGRLNLYRGVYRLSEGRVDPECGCISCARYSRAYLHHLTKAGEVLGWQLLTKHNLHFYHALTATMRRHIVADTFAAYYEEQRDVLMRGDDEYPSRPPTVRRVRRDPRALERFEVRESPHGYASIVHRRSGEIMHAGLDPSAEAQALYVDQSRLAERLREPGPEPLVVWDVGLGAAHNAMAVLRCRSMLDGTARRPLRLVSFEHDLGSLRLALRNATRFPHLHRAGPNAILRSGEWRSPEEAVVWTLLEGDFRARLPEAPLPDLIFYDPFSAKTDTAMWTLECFDRLFGACGEGDTELFTYSASTAVRAALLAAGFVVGRGAPTGAKSETTVALTPLAARHSAARGRVLLGTEWLERWQRSHTRYRATCRPTTTSRSPNGLSRTPSFRVPARPHDTDRPMTVWIVDAMNVIGSRPTGWWRDRSAAVSRLLDATRRLVAATREPVALVVDGRPPPEFAEGEADGVRVIYAMRAGRNAADDRIVELVASDPEPAALRVVTSDRALQERVRALGAQVVSPREWLRRVDSTGPVP